MLPARGTRCCIRLASFARLPSRCSLLELQRPLTSSDSNSIWSSSDRLTSPSTTSLGSEVSKRKQFKQNISPKRHSSAHCRHTPVVKREFHFHLLLDVTLEEVDSFFPKIAIDPKVLRHLDLMGMGMEKKNVERGRKMRLYRRGAVSSAVPGATVAAVKPRTFDHPTWAAKKLCSVSTLTEIPPPAARLPEVALVGRSNVGKSTLLNALLGLKRHPDRRASVSDTPGETRTLDFFQLGKGEKARIILADMPGYGFAFAREKQREDWKGLMMAYLRGRAAPLKRVMLLLDARHGFKKADIEFLELLYDPKGPSPLGKYHPPKIQILLTKCDLVKRIDLARRVALVRHQLDEVSRRQTNLSIMMVSALRGAGIVELQRELAALDPKPTAAANPAESDGDPRTKVVETPKRVVPGHDRSSRTDG